MPISGPTVSQQIQLALQAAEQALAAARAHAAEVGQSINALAEDRQQVFGDLAEYDLPELSQAAIAQTRADARPALEQILLRQADRVSRLEDQLKLLEGQRKEAEGELEGTNQVLDDLLQQQQDLSERLTTTLQSNEVFRESTERAAEAEAALERAEASLAEIEQEAMQKLPAYESSRLFMYLWNRGLATPRYKPRGFTRRMDRWVSRLIDYPKAKMAYEYLKQTPEDVRVLVTQDRKVLTAVMDQLEQQRDEEAERIGLPAVTARVDQADAEHQRVLSSLDGLGQSIDTTRTQLMSAEDPRGEFYREAIEYLKNLLRRESPQTLEDRALRTADPRDDQIVARLRHLDVQVQQVNTETAARQQQIEWYDRHISDLGRFQQRFRAAGFDSGRSLFDDSVNLVNEFALVCEGHDTVDGVWKRLRQKQQFARSTMGIDRLGQSRGVNQPMTQVLVHAMGSVAGNARSDHARRAGQRATSAHGDASTRGGFHTRNKI